MWEMLEEIKYFKLEGRGCVPNLRGAIPVGTDGRSYTARTVEPGKTRSSSGRPEAGR